jgi:hypothetical protein
MGGADRAAYDYATNLRAPDPFTASGYDTYTSAGHGLSVGQVARDESAGSGSGTGASTSTQSTGNPGWAGPPGGSDTVGPILSGGSPQSGGPPSSGAPGVPGAPSDGPPNGGTRPADPWVWPRPVSPVSGVSGPGLPEQHRIGGSARSGRGPGTGEWDDAARPGAAGQPATGRGGGAAANANEAGHGVFGPGGIGGSGTGGASRRRRSQGVPYAEWVVPKGVPPVLQAPPEPAEHDPGPGVIGIDR